MVNLFIKSNDEIIVINKAGYYPQKVLDEGDSLNADTQIHSFFWNYNGPHNSHDYEPVAVDKNKKFVLTRFHERGVILWIDYKNEHAKPIVHFFTAFHTPMLCTGHSPHLLKEPTIFEDRMAYTALFLAYFVPREMSKAIKKKGKYQLNDYRKIYSSEKVLEEKKFRWSKLEYIIIVGPAITLETLKIPKKVRDELKMIILR